MNNLKLTAPAFLSAAVFAFCLWSIFWVVDGRKNHAVGIENAKMSINFRVANTSLLDKPDAVGDFVRVLEKNNAALTVVSDGDGLPVVSIIDPNKKLPLSKLLGDSHATRNVVYAVNGRFSEEEYKRKADPSLLSGTETVSGSLSEKQIPGISRAEAIQYVIVPQKSEPVPIGTYFVDSTDKMIAKEIADVGTKYGLKIGGVSAPAFLDELIHNSLFILSGALLLAGFVCAWMFWAYWFDTRSNDLQIRKSHGATPKLIAYRYAYVAIPKVILSSALGVILVAGSALLVARKAFNAEILPWLLGALILNTAACILLWAFASAWALKRLDVKTTRLERAAQ